MHTESICTVCGRNCSSTPVPFFVCHFGLDNCTRVVRMFRPPAGSRRGVYPHTPVSGAAAASHSHRLHQDSMPRLHNDEKQRADTDMFSFCVGIRNPHLKSPVSAPSSSSPLASTTAFAGHAQEPIVRLNQPLTSSAMSSSASSTPKPQGGSRRLSSEKASSHLVPLPMSTVSALNYNSTGRPQHSAERKMVEGACYSRLDLNVHDADLFRLCNPS